MEGVFQMRRRLRAEAAQRITQVERCIEAADAELEQLEREASRADRLSHHRPKMQKLNGSLEPRCPSCGSKMRRRTAKRGPSRGQAFLGCTKWPACTGTLSLEDGIRAALGGVG